MAERVVKNSGLTWKDTFRIRLLEFQRESAKDEERLRIDQQIASIKQHSVEEKTKSAPSPKVTTPEQPITIKAEPGEDDRVNILPPLEDLPHAPYCTVTETAPMVKMDGKWMTYAMYREKNPDKNVFDLNPMDIAIMYLNLRKYRELQESGEAQDCYTSCLRRIPEAVGPVELIHLEGLLLYEAYYDPRIKELGYEGETMDDC